MTVKGNNKDNENGSFAEIIAKFLKDNGVEPLPKLAQVMSRPLILNHLNEFQMSCASFNEWVEASWDVVIGIDDFVACIDSFINHFAKANDIKIPVPDEDVDMASDGSDPEVSDA